MNIDFIDLIEQKVDLNFKGLNRFIYKLHVKSRYKDIVKKLKKTDIRNNPPSFELMWSFSNFIKYLEVAYLYSGPAHSISIRKDLNSFVILKKNEYKIIFSLDQETRNIDITINREHGSIPKTVFKVTPDFKIETETDAKLFLMLEKILVDTMIEVLKYAYKKYNNIW